MSNTQFFVLLGVTLTGVIWQRVDYHQLNSRIDRVEQQLNGRIDQLSGRIDRVEQELSGRIDQLSGRIDRISDDLKHFYKELGRHEKAIENLEKHS